MQNANLRAGLEWGPDPGFVQVAQPKNLIEGRSGRSIVPQNLFKQAAKRQRNKQNKAMMTPNSTPRK